MSQMLSQDIVASNKHCALFLVSFDKTHVDHKIIPIVTLIFNEIAPFIKNPTTTVYIRNIKEYCIEGKYPGGNAYTQYEVQISIPKWPPDKSQFTASIAHELHHIGRWQTVGYGKTLGEQITTEGVASLFEYKKSGWRPPWTKISIPKKIKIQALSLWDSTNFSHKEWFYKGPMGRWIGYSLGYELVVKYFQKKFDLKESLFLSSEKLKLLLKT